MQAAWQALQPMHLVTSISFAISVCRSAGGVTVEAERRIRSFSPNFGELGAIAGFGIGGNMVLSPLRNRRPGRRLEIDQKRLEFRRLDIGIADERRQCVGR